ncbi:hypothetical protein ZIOFF_022303 [Zingiber officinale]|uniref:Mitochondrial inner membrane protease ATP23 n=2 Tax=Zingiber officinale TaxID=94328 RepID=A0A8J5LH49_ZINOF|nr:hypothetical protein ZIOFF_022303 [Zingiber officinale]
MQKTTTKKTPRPSSGLMAEAAPDTGSGAAAGAPIPDAGTGVETTIRGSGMPFRECVDRINKSLDHPKVRFLREHMLKAGCPVWVQLLMPLNCNSEGLSYAGGYARGKGVCLLLLKMMMLVELVRHLHGIWAKFMSHYWSTTFINFLMVDHEWHLTVCFVAELMFFTYYAQLMISVCCNHMTFQDEINQVLIHELIHAYDDCRAKNITWSNCAHHACSEIRANHLSGDCHYKRELLRGYTKLRGHEQECVKRRALKSLQLNPNCSGAAAKDAIEAVWDICYNDTYPFERAP